MASPGAQLHQRLEDLSAQTTVGARGMLTQLDQVKADFSAQFTATDINSRLPARLAVLAAAQLTPFGGSARAARERRQLCKEWNVPAATLDRDFENNKAEKFFRSLRTLATELDYQTAIVLLDQAREERLQGQLFSKSWRGIRRTRDRVPWDIRRAQEKSGRFANVSPEDSGRETTDEHEDGPGQRSRSPPHIAVVDANVTRRPKRQRSASFDAPRTLTRRTPWLRSHAASSGSRPPLLPSAGSLEMPRHHALDDDLDDDLFKVFEVAAFVSDNSAASLHNEDLGLDPAGAVGGHGTGLGKSNDSGKDETNAIEIIDGKGEEARDGANDGGDEDNTDVRCLRPGVWVEDVVFNKVLDTLALLNPSWQFVDSLHVTSQSPTRHTLNTLHSTEIVFGLHLQNHWILVTLVSTRREINVYDSLPSADHFCRACIAIQSFFAKFLPQETWTEWCVSPRACPLQGNTYDCGVFALLTACRLATGLPLPVCADGALWRRLLAGLLSRKPAADDHLRSYNDEHEDATWDLGATALPPPADGSRVLPEKLIDVAMAQVLHGQCAVAAAREAVAQAQSAELSQRVGRVADAQQTLAALQVLAGKALEGLSADARAVEARVQERESVLADMRRVAPEAATAYVDFAQNVRPLCAELRRLRAGEKRLGELVEKLGRLRGEWEGEAREAFSAAARAGWMACSHQ